VSPPNEFVQGILYLAPGFLALKAFSSFGAQRTRSDWEWAAWSVIASLPINALAGFIRSFQAPSANPPDGLEIVYRLAVGVGLGLIGAGIWQRIRIAPWGRAQRFRERVTDSPWDHVLEEVGASHRVTELVMSDGARYRGTIRYAGREDAGAREWVYLKYVEVFDAGKFRDSKHTHGLLVHREEIRRIRVLKTEEEEATVPKDESVRSALMGLLEDATSKDERDEIQGMLQRFQRHPNDDTPVEVIDYLNSRNVYLDDGDQT
jgi:uncharacterized protein DUF6338